MAIPSSGVDRLRKRAPRADEDNHLSAASQSGVEQFARKHHALAFVNGNDDEGIFRPLRAMDGDGETVSQFRKRGMRIYNAALSESDRNGFACGIFHNAAFAVENAEVVVVSGLQDTVVRLKVRL